MQYITLYRYKRKDGGITVSPNIPSTDFTILHRIVADEGKLLKKGNIETSVIDTDNIDGWSEIDAPIEETENIFQEILNTP